jgi:hypothetical protein
MKFTFENVATAIGSLWLYFGLLATPEKIIVVSLAFMTICVFCFSVWAYFQMRKSDNRTNDLLDLFQKRFITTETRADLLTGIHIRRHPEDAAAFYASEREITRAAFKDMQDGAVCGSCKVEDKD